MKRSLLSLLAALPVLGGEFINLTFDEPDLSGPLVPDYPDGPLRGGVAKLLRGWTVQANGQPVDSMLFSPYPPGVGGSDLVNLQQSRPGDSPLLGFASLFIYSPLPSELPPRPLGPEIRLSQRGTIPADAAGMWLASGYVQVFADGLKIGEVNPMVGGRSIIDVSPYAGQEVNLEFLVSSGDSIRFDILGFVPIPEPSTWALLGTGLAAVCWLTRRK